MFVLECLRHSNKKEKILNCLSFATLFSAFVFLLIVFYWSAYPYEPLVINKTPFYVITKEVKQGDMLNYEIDYCKNTKLTSHVSRSFVDGILFTMPTVDGANKPGCGVNNIFSEIPKELPIGDYKLVITYIYKVNPLREISVIAESEPFTVLPKD